MQPQMGDLADQQMHADRFWFINYPFATKYYRKPFEYELIEFASFELGRKIKKMLVIKVDNDARVRQPIFEEL